MAISFLGTFAFRLQVPVIAFYSRDVLGGTALDIGMLTAMFMIGRAAAASIAGYIYEWRAIRLVPALCFSLNAPLVIAYLYTDTITLYMFLRAVQGVLNGFAWVVIQIALGASTPSRARGTVYAIYFAIGSLGIAVANYVYSMLAYLPIAIPLYIASILFIATALLSTLPRYPRTSLSSERTSLKSGRELCIPLLLFVGTVSLGSAYVSGDIVYVYLREMYGLSKDVVGLFMSIATAIAILLSIVLSIVADRVSDQTALTVITMLTAIAMALATPYNIYTTLLAISTLSIALKSTIAISRRIALTYIGPKGVGYINTANNIGTVLSSITIGTLYENLRNTVIPHPIPLITTTTILAIPITTTLVTTYITTTKTLQKEKP